MKFAEEVEDEVNTESDMVKSKDGNVEVRDISMQGYTCRGEGTYI